MIAYGNEEASEDSFNISIYKCPKKTRSTRGSEGALQSDSSISPTTVIFTSHFLPQPLDAVKTFLTRLAVKESMTRGTSYVQDPGVRGRQASSVGRLVTYPPEVRESRSNDVPNPGLAPRSPIPTSSSPLQWQPPLLPHFRFSSLPLNWMREPAAACRACRGGWR
jgi:hypothetical protein